MRILLTNDDGIDCEGIAALARGLAQAHEVWTVAPDSDRSGTANAITLRYPSKIMQRGERSFSCSGMPVDCVILGVLAVMDAWPDLVISGINRGPNLGTDLAYSGTAGAARQAALMGIPAIAVSLAGKKPPFHFEEASAFVAARLDELASLWKPSIYINLNLPNCTALPAALNRASLSRRTYKDQISEYSAPDGTRFCFLGEGLVETHAPEGSDAWFVDRGEVSVSKILVDPVAEALA
jgi:5'-nucleotidase